MPAIIPLGELTREQKIGFRRSAQSSILRKAVDIGIATQADVVVRDLAPGDVTDAAVTDFKDIEPVTAATAGMEFWAEDAADITANDLSNVLQGEATGNRVPDNKTMGFFGFFDLTDIPDLVAIRFRRGSDTLDFWQVEQCYAYPDERGGMYEGVIIYEANDPLSIQMNFKTAADRFVGLHGYIAERYGEQISKA